MCKFDAKVAERDIREALYQVSDMLGKTKEEIDARVHAAVIKELQEKRIEYLPDMKDIKKAMEMRFRNARFEGRIKSLASIMGKHVQGRSLFDLFGFRIIVHTQDEAYAMIEWLKEKYGEFEFKDKVKNPKANGYQDLKLVCTYLDTYVEFIVQTQQQYIDAKTIQRHSSTYPWKYHEAILGLPKEYDGMPF